MAPQTNNERTSQYHTAAEGSRKGLFSGIIGTPRVLSRVAIQRLTIRRVAARPRPWITLLTCICPPMPGFAALSGLRGEAHTGVEEQCSCTLRQTDSSQFDVQDPAISRAGHHR